MKKLATILLTALLIFGLIGTAFAEKTVEEYEPNPDYFPGYVYDTKGISAYKSKSCKVNGTVETLTYETAGEEGPIEKTLHVYLPAGYDGSVDCNVLYLMHGGGENQDYWLMEGDDHKHGKTTLRVLDHMFEDGLCENVIIVTPTNTGSADFTSEIRNDIIPLIETRYAVFSHGDMSEENLIATRDHRAYAGFSMGSMVGFNSIMKGNLDIFGYLGNWSGGSGAQEIKDAMDSKFPGYKLTYWYNGNGTDDFALDGHFVLYYEMLEINSDYVDAENCCFVLKPGAGHNYAAWIVDLYNVLQVFFK